ncbi:CrcB family protein [Brucella thiophenivorans]|uniref:Fluoride-specific ion channel FluC n=1 Tax=Brucella thiophenivorans TaxID=571255 RepID=A0A256G1S8_9HYPH|nr:CrcB family protein [Brucella thiophenivorans]OYR21054.1 crcB-like family protein [Brucella thiophenivorans]
MINTIIFVFVGGAVGAMLREFLMLGVPNLSDGIPMSILVANVVASFLLGLTTSLYQKGTLSQGVNTLVATGIMGGLSTFSSFVYGAYVLMSGSTAGMMSALLYLALSIVLGYIAVVLGLRLGNRD